MFNAHERRTVWPSWHEGQTDSGISIYSRLARAQLYSGKWRGEKGEGGGWGGEGEEEEEEEQEAASVFAPPKVHSSEMATHCRFLPLTSTLEPE